MLASIISSFKRAEHLNVDYLMEQVVMMNALGIIKDNAAECLLRYAVDLKAYNTFVGRNTNIRPGDYTSIWKSGKALEFIKRIFKKEGASIPDEIGEKKPLFVFLVHNALWHFKLYARSFPLLKMIHIKRHPVDIVASWFRRRYGRDMKNDFYNGTLTIQAKDKHLLYYVAGKEEEFAEMPEADRVVHMIRDAEINHCKTFDALAEDEKRRVKIVYFERLVTDPGPVLKELTSFLETEKTKNTRPVCRRERCPRVLNSGERSAKLDYLKNNCSHSTYELLVRMSNNYEEELQ